MIICTLQISGTKEILAILEILVFVVARNINEWYRKKKNKVVNKVPNLPFRKTMNEVVAFLAKHFLTQT